MKNKKEKENKRTEETKEKTFSAIVLAIIFDPHKRKILIGRRENDPYVSELKWTPPGGRVFPGEDLEVVLKKKIKLQTGFNIENLGNIFTMIPEEKKNHLLILYLCEVIGGEQKVGGNLKELRWVNPEDLDEYFTIAYHPHLREYINNLK